MTTVALDLINYGRTDGVELERINNYENMVGFSGITFVTSLMKIGQLVQT
jgi:hypothetical protein